MADSNKNGFFRKLLPYILAIVAFVIIGYAYAPYTLSGKVVVPATITVDENEYQVIKIGTQAFASNTTIEEIELPEGIEEIAASAFSGAEALTKLNIPQSVKAIPNSIIYNSGIYNNDANYTNKCLYIDGCLLETKSDISGTVQVKEGTRLISGSAFAGRNFFTRRK
jgi:hypothetical protein